MGDHQAGDVVCSHDLLGQLQHDLGGAGVQLFQGGCTSSGEVPFCEEG